jgi:hypothetical protein
MMNLPPYEGDLVLTQLSSNESCMIASPDELPSGTWVSTTTASNLIIGQAKLEVLDDTGVKQSVLEGMTIEVADPKDHPPGFIASFQVDPAVAPFIAIKTTVIEFKVDDSIPGKTTYGKVYAETNMAGEPAPEYSGSADLGTRVGTVESRPMTMGEWGHPCYKYDDTLAPGFWTGTFEWYVVAEIYLVDHKGGAYPLGTSTYRLSADVSA